MATGGRDNRTTVNSRGGVPVPAEIRRRLDIEPGDEFQWEVAEDGTLHVEVVRQRFGAFEDDDVKANLGGDGLESHDLAGGEPEGRP
jgi:AbrB family looped-hinge helix DNA binding protein